MNRRSGTHEERSFKNKGMYFMHFLLDLAVKFPGILRFTQLIDLLKDLLGCGTEVARNMYKMQRKGNK